MSFYLFTPKGDNTKTLNIIRPDDTEIEKPFEVTVEEHQDVIHSKW